MTPVATNRMWNLRKDWIVPSDANACLICLRDRLAILENIQAVRLILSSLDCLMSHLNDCDWELQ